MKFAPIEVEIVSVRPYEIESSPVGVRKMVELVFISPDGETFRTSKRVYPDSEPFTKGKWTVQFTVIPDKLLKPQLGTIEF